MKLTTLRWYNGEFSNLEFLYENIWFKPIDFKFVQKGVRCLKCKPENISDYVGAEKWRKNH